MRNLTVLAFSLALTSLGAVAASPSPPAYAAPVTTDRGRLDGVTLDSGVRAYLGIPYAEAPVGSLRWREPQPRKPWTQVYHADKFGPQCTQPQRGLLTNQYSGPEVTSEDCLYLNVWTRPELKNAPVIVYFHGGGFFIGSGSMALYGGENVAQKGAVYVNANYRLGVLGFLALPELSAESPHKTSGNFAFLDQIAALQWVRRNIAQFGGDPDNVTIAGQSAGSMSVIALQASPLAKGLFHRAIGMSGALIGTDPAGRMATLGAAEREGSKFAALVKASNLAELRALPADRLVVPRVPGSPSIGPIQDGYVLPTSIEKTFATATQNDVPLMLGFARDESLGGFGRINDLNDYRTKAANRFGERSAEFLKLYPASTDEEARTQARLSDRDSTMVASMNLWARAQVASGRAAVYAYEFARPHSYSPGVSFTDMDPAIAGAYHTSEVPYWLGTLESFNRYRRTRNWTQADKDFSAAMTESMVAFARSGDPSTSRVRWARYQPDTEELLELGETTRLSRWPEPERLRFFLQQTRAAPRGGAARD